MPNNLYKSIFGDSPDTQQAYQQRNNAYQSWLNTRKQTAERQRTDDVKMARYNALGNLLTTMVQPVGWSAGNRGTGATGGFQPYDNRQYLAAFNRAVKAADDIRNIGTQEGEYQFKLADEAYRRQLALDDEARRRQYSLEDSERKAQQKIDELNQRFQNDMAKIERQGQIRQQIAEFNAAHRITSRSGGYHLDERMKMELLKAYNKYAQDQESLGNQAKSYPDWLSERGYNYNTTSTATTQRPATKSIGW